MHFSMLTLPSMIEMSSGMLDIQSRARSRHRGRARSRHRGRARSRHRGRARSRHRGRARSRHRGLPPRMARATIHPQGFRGGAVSPAAAVTGVVLRARVKQHRWNIVAALATSMFHPCRFRAGADPDPGAPGGAGVTGGMSKAGGTSGAGGADALASALTADTPAALAAPLAAGPWRRHWRRAHWREQRTTGAGSEPLARAANHWRGQRTTGAGSEPLARRPPTMAWPAGCRRASPRLAV
jgi:hypothetical protein